jgi:hypothetical protein
MLDCVSKNDGKPSAWVEGRVVFSVRNAITSGNRVQHMDTWHAILYAVASFLAVKSLISLMVAHRRRYWQQLMSELEAERRFKAKQAKKQAREQQAEAQRRPAA